MCLSSKKKNQLSTFGRSKLAALVTRRRSLHGPWPRLRVNYPINQHARPTTPDATPTFAISRRSHMRRLVLSSEMGSRGVSGEPMALVSEFCHYVRGSPTPTRGRPRLHDPDAFSTSPHHPSINITAAISNSPHQSWDQSHTGNAPFRSCRSPDCLVMHT